MQRKIFIAVEVIAGLAALVSIGVPSVTSAAKQPATSAAKQPMTSVVKQPATERAPVARVTKGGGFAQTGTWTFEGKTDLHDSGALELKIRSIAGAPRAFDMVRRLLVGRDVVLVNTQVAIVDISGRAVAPSQLNDAIVRVKGTLLSAGQWRYDLEGEATPAVRVSRITVLGLD